MRPVWFTILLVTVAFAGCADDEPVPVNDDLTATETTGVIRGVVVDAAIAPIAGAVVSVTVPDEAPLTVTTTETGAFGFQDLSPGTYFVKVAKIGYFPAQASADVVAGVAAPEAVRVLLERDVENTPALEVLKFAGYIECSLTTPAVRLAACSVPNLGTEIACDESGGQVCLGNVTNDNFLPRHRTVGRAPTFLQSEMLWDSTNLFGDNMLALPGTYSESGSTDLASFEGPSPLVMPLNQSVLGNLGQGHGYQLRIFASYMDGTSVAGQWGVGATIQQEFEIFSHVFYGFRPVEGWQFSVDGTPAVPQ